MRVGLTGGIGSGKTEVAKLLREFGAFVIDTDQLAREAVAPGSDGWRAVAAQWPEVVGHGTLDRLALADIVFGDPTARERLNAIVHPYVRRRAAALEARARPEQLIVHVVPLLFETGYDGLVDRTILAVAPEAQRVERVKARDSLDESRIRARMVSQIEPNRARERADEIIENDGDLSTLRERTRRVYDRLRRC